MFRENTFRENVHPPRTNPRPVNIEVECSCELSHAKGIPWKKRKVKNRKCHRPGFEPGTAPVGGRHFAHWAMEIPYACRRWKLCIDCAQQRIITAQRQRGVEWWWVRPAWVYLNFLVFRPKICAKFTWFLPKIFYLIYLKASLGIYSKSEIRDPAEFQFFWTQKVTAWL